MPSEDRVTSASVLLPVTKATPWINSFVLIEKRGNHVQVKLRICLNPTNLNKAVTREPYHFRSPKDISHMLADACILTVCDCKKGYWHQTLDEASSYLTTFNTEVGRYRFAVMPFGIMVVWDIFQWKLDECFGHIKNLIVIADDIMVIRKNHNHKDHDIAFTTLLQTARRCNVKLNYDQTEVQVYRGQLLWRNIYNRWVQASPGQNCSHCQNAFPQLQKRGTILYWHDQLLNKIFTKINWISWTYQRTG